MQALSVQSATNEALGTSRTSPWTSKVAMPAPKRMPTTRLGAILRVSHVTSAVSMPKPASASVTSAPQSARSHGWMGASSKPAANAVARVAATVTTTNAAASTTTSTVRVARNARRFGCTVNTFLLKPLSNSAARKMAMKMTNSTASPPPFRNRVPTSASAEVPAVMSAAASAASW